MALFMRSPETKVTIINKRKQFGISSILTFLQVLDIATRKSNPDFVDFGAGHGGTSCIVFLFSLSDVTHCISF